MGILFAELKAVKKSALNANAKEGRRRRVELEKPRGGAAIVTFHSARTIVSWHIIRDFDAILQKKTLEYNCYII